MRWIQPVTVLLVLLAPAAGAGELEDLVAKFQAERDRPYAERYRTANEFARFKDEKARAVVIALYRQEKDANVRTILLRAIGGHEGPEARAILVEALRDFGQPSQQYAAAQALSGKVDAPAAKILLELLADSRTNVTLARYLRDALASTKDEDALKWLAGPGLATQEKKTLLVVLDVVGRTGTRHAIAPLERLVKSRDPDVQRAAVEALGGIDDPSVRDTLKKLADARDPELAARALRGLARYAQDDPEVARELLSHLRSSAIERKLAAADALGEAGFAGAAPDLVKMLGDRAWEVRAAAILNLRRLRAKEAIGPLIDRLDEEEGRLQGDVVDALEDLTGQPFGFSPANWKGWWRVNEATFVVPPKKAPSAEVPDEGGTTAGYYGIRILSQRIVFIVDQSGSMSAAAVTGASTGAAGAPSRNRLDVAKERLEAVVASLSPRVQFNIVFFESGFKTWKKGLVPATDANKREGIEYTRSQQPTGGTNVFDPLEAAILMEGVDTIVLLTDGDPGSGKFVAADDIVREIEKLNRTRRVKIDTIALGGARKLLEDLSAASGGRYVEAR